jgi:hypothetical protein
VRPVFFKDPPASDSHVELTAPACSPIQLLHCYLILERSEELLSDGAFPTDLSFPPSESLYHLTLVKERSQVAILKVIINV